jgi:beta-alanine degradation protein BauB
MNNLGRRHMAVLLSGLSLLGAMGTSAAQDVVKVSPETHRVLLENDRVRVLDVRIKPGERVAMHSHPPSVVHYLSDGSLRITYPDGRTEVREVKTGTAVWSEAATHAAENVGTREFHELQIELKEEQRKNAALKVTD